MNPGDLDRTLSLLARQAAGVRERLAALSSEISAARAVIVDIAASVRGADGESAPAPERAANRKPEPGTPQAEAAYK